MADKEEKKIRHFGIFPKRIIRVLDYSRSTPSRLVYKYVDEILDMKLATSNAKFGEFLKNQKSKWKLKVDGKDITRWDKYAIQEVPDAIDDIVMTFVFNKKGDITDSYYELGTIAAKQGHRMDKYNYKAAVYCIDDLNNNAMMINGEKSDADVYFVLYKDNKGKKKCNKWYVYRELSGKWEELASLKDDFSTTVRAILTKEDFGEDPDDPDDEYYDDNNDGNTGDGNSLYDIALERAMTIRKELFGKEFKFEIPEPEPEPEPGD